jgi:hypothetical protein
MNIDVSNAVINPHCANATVDYKWIRAAAKAAGTVVGFCGIEEMLFKLGGVYHPTKVRIVSEAIAREIKLAVEG